MDDLNPVLFESDARSFDSLGIGVLSDVISCVVTEERNGSYELELQYPVSGRLYSELKNRRIISCQVNRAGDKEPFRIYQITKPLSRVVTVCAAHISYDLSGIALSPFSAVNAQAALQGFTTYSVGDNPFTFSTDKQTTANFKVSVPCSIRSYLGGKRGSVLDVYGGEYAYHGFSVRLCSARGANRGVTIRYGKNLTDIKQEENIQSVYTATYPYWASDTDYMELPEKVVNAEGTFGFTRIMPLDASSEFDDKPSAEQLRNFAKAYMKNNEIGVPRVSISVAFVALEQSQEYADILPLQEVMLCDTVSVKFEELGVDASAKCVRTKFDVLRNRYLEIELGEAKTNIADTIVENKKQAETAAKDAVSGLSQMDIFKKLTDNGRIQGLYIQDGKWYINAEVVKVINLVADVVKSVSGSSEVRIDGSILSMLSGGSVTMQLNNSADGLPIMYMSGNYGGTKERSELTPQLLKIGGSSATPSAIVSGASGTDWDTSTLSGKGSVKANTVSGVNVHGASFRLLNMVFAAVIDGLRQINLDNLQPSGNGNCRWEYSSTLGKTVLIKI